MGSETDKYLQKIRRDSADNLKNAQQQYEAIANQRLANAARGEWSPWLAIQQNLIEHTKLMPAERAMPGVPASGYATQYSNDRARRWNEAMKLAEELAAKGGGSIPNFPAQ